MLTSIEGIYENGQIRLLEPIPGVARARVVVTLLPETPSSPPDQPPPADTATVDTATERFRPRSALGRKLLALRRRHAGQAEPLLNLEEIEAELRERRGGLPDD